MVYCDNYMTVRISQVAEVAHDGEALLFLTHISGAKNQTRYQNTPELLQAYAVIQEMVVKQETGKGMQQHAADGTMVVPPATGPGPGGGSQSNLSLVDDSEEPS